MRGRMILFLWIVVCTPIIHGYRHMLWHLIPGDHLNHWVMTYWRTNHMVNSARRPLKAGWDLFVEAQIAEHGLFSGGFRSLMHHCLCVAEQKIWCGDFPLLQTRSRKRWMVRAYSSSARCFWQHWWNRIALCRLLPFWNTPETQSSAAREVSTAESAPQEQRATADGVDPMAKGSVWRWPDKDSTFLLLKADVSKAHRRIKILRSGWKYQVAQIDQQWWVNKVGTYGVASAQLYWGRMAAHPLCTVPWGGLGICLCGWFLLGPQSIQRTMADTCTAGGSPGFGNPT